MHPHLYKQNSIMSRIILLLFIDAFIKKKCSQVLQMNWLVLQPETNDTSRYCVYFFEEYALVDMIPERLIVGVVFDQCCAIGLSRAYN